MGLWYFTLALGTYCLKDAVQNDPPNKCIYKPGEKKIIFQFIQNKNTHRIMKI